nr:ribosomal protein L4 [uncultured bacterium]
MQATIYDHSGKEVEKLSLPGEIFAVAFNHDLVHRALMRELANARQATKKTKKRSEVRGGGKKPWRQKGTGRARCGSNRSPIWRGGGITFGPTGEENYQLRMNRKEARKALYCTLSKQASEGRIIGLSEYPHTEAKTKQFAQMISSLPITRDVLVVLPEKNAIIQKSARNLPHVKVTTSNDISVADLLKHDRILFLKEVFAQWQRVAKGGSLVEQKTEPADQTVAAVTK